MTDRETAEICRLTAQLRQRLHEIPEPALRETRTKETLMAFLREHTPLEVGGRGFFPDAPTARGTKHLRELAAAAAGGRECWLAFVIALPGVRTVSPNRATDPAFGDALDAARQAGVRVLYLPCAVAPDGLRVTEALTD